MPTLTRRRLLTAACQMSLAVTLAPLARAAGGAATMQANEAAKALRCINVMNFLRGSEPRNKTDLLLPAKEQMKLIVARKLPATWLLQFDALVAGPFVPFLKDTIPADHEAGFWFEMNKPLCDAAGVAWRGRPGYDWDHYPDVAFTIGYTPDERVKLADTAMAEFKRVWGYYPKSVASWNLDSLTLAHLADKYDVDAAGVCRDQIATDGFTIWGAPIAGYYPSKTNLWSPAVDPANQVRVPVLRLLGQDPVYYYDNQYPLAGKVVREPDTMEPVWKSGRSKQFVDSFFKMIAREPTLRFAYAQLGQENSFGWKRMAAAYPTQMDALAALRDAGAVTVETMGGTGARFKRAFDVTPPQAQVMLADPYANADPAERSVWYQSRFYRANLHLKGDLAYVRDLTVYSDHFPQPFLHAATRDRMVHQRMPAVMDGFHWRKDGGPGPRPTAGGFFSVGGKPVRLAGPATVREDGAALDVTLPVTDGQAVRVRFEERAVRLTTTAADRLTLAMEYDAGKAPGVEVRPDRVAYRWQELDYAVAIAGGSARATDQGWTLEADAAGATLTVAQAS